MGLKFWRCKSNENIVLEFQVPLQLSTSFFPLIITCFIFFSNKKTGYFVSGYHIVPIVKSGYSGCPMLPLTITILRNLWLLLFLSAFDFHYSAQPLEFVILVKLSVNFLIHKNMIPRNKINPKKTTKWQLKRVQLIYLDSGYHHELKIGQTSHHIGIPNRYELGSVKIVCI